MKIHFVIHESFEGPAAIERWAKKRGHEISYTRLHEGNDFPKKNGFDLLIVMGGPQSPATTTRQCAHFDGKKEIAFVKKAIEDGKRVFGVCLGAQIIGEAMGAKFGHSPNKEVGVFPVELTTAGKKDPFVSSFPVKFMVGHWHGDMPGLTKQSEVLATSEGCPRQIVRYTPKVYGFQCHFEFDRSAIEGLIKYSGNDITENKGKPYIETEQELRAHDYDDMNGLLFGFLDKFTA